MEIVGSKDRNHQHQTTGVLMFGGRPNERTESFVDRSPLGWKCPARSCVLLSRSQVLTLGGLMSPLQVQYTVRQQVQAARERRVRARCLQVERLFLREPIELK